MRSRPSQTSRKPRLTILQILKWADEYHQRQGTWPHHFSGRIPFVDETWSGVNDALARGRRGLPGSSTLARELFIHRGVRSPRNVPDLDLDQIFDWAQRHHRKTGNWPTLSDGQVAEAPGETWAALDIALARGTRGLPGGSSIAQLLAEREAKRNLQRLGRLSERKILSWADAFFQAHGHWPYPKSGIIAGTTGETWSSVNKALQRGRRGLTGGSSLSDFLNQHRDIYGGKTRRPRQVPADRRLSIEVIRAWGEAYRKRHGVWPNRDSGPVADADGVTWSAINSGLKAGSRGLPGGSSLARLFGGGRKTRTAGVGHLTR